MTPVELALGLEELTHPQVEEGRGGEAGDDARHPAERDHAGHARRDAYDRPENVTPIAPPSYSP